MEGIKANSIADLTFKFNYPNTPSMAPDAIGRALKEANVKFDFIALFWELSSVWETLVWEVEYEVLSVEYFWM